MNRPPVQLTLLFLVITALLFATNDVFAGPEYDASDITPRIENILFTKEAVGFVTKVYPRQIKYYIYDRKSWSLKPVKKEWFLKKFDVRHTPEPSVEKGPTTTLRASNGLEFRTEGGYCFENQKKQVHKLWLGGMLIKDHADPCRKITAVEAVDDKLWLGTVYQGGTGNKDRGLVIQSLKDGKLIKEITQKDGLSLNNILIIRHDPYTGKFLAAAHRGLSLINKYGKVEKTGFFYEDFDPDTGKPVFYIKKSFKESNLLAGIERNLGVEDTMAYYKAVQTIPKDVLSEVSPYSYYMGSWSTSSHFLPQEMNVLVPFFLEAAQSDRKDNKLSAQIRICAFNDKRVIRHIQTLALAERPNLWTRRCIDKYAKLGLLDDDYKIDREEALLKKLIKALADIRPDNPSFTHHPAAISGTNYAGIVISSTESLIKMGNFQSFELIKKFYEAFDLKTAENNQDYMQESLTLYSSLLRGYSFRKKIKPIVIEGIKKGLMNGCMYFDTNYEHSYGKQLGAKYAEIMLVSIDKFHNVQKKPISLPPGFHITEEEIEKITVDDHCGDAFGSQMKNKNVKKDFLKNYYPKLTKRQKKMADSLLDGSYKSPGADDIKKQLREHLRKQPDVTGMGIPFFRQRGD